MTTLVWLIIIAGILLAITRLGLTIRRHEDHHEVHTPPQSHPTPRSDRHMIDPMS